MTWVAVERAATRLTNFPVLSRSSYGEPPVRDAQGDPAGTGRLHPHTFQHDPQPDRVKAMGSQRRCGCGVVALALASGDVDALQPGGVRPLERRRPRCVQLGEHLRPVDGLLARGCALDRGWRRDRLLPRPRRAGPADQGAQQQHPGAGGQHPRSDALRPPADAGASPGLGGGARNGLVHPDGLGRGRRGQQCCQFGGAGTARREHPGDARRARRIAIEQRRKHPLHGAHVSGRITGGSEHAHDAHAREHRPPVGPQQHISIAEPTMSDACIMRTGQRPAQRDAERHDLARGQQPAPGQQMQPERRRRQMAVDESHSVKGLAHRTDRRQTRVIQREEIFRQSLRPSAQNFVDGHPQEPHPALADPGKVGRQPLAPVARQPSGDPGAPHLAPPDRLVGIGALDQAQPVDLRYPFVHGPHARR